MPTADALGFVDWKSHALQCSQPENGKTEKLKEISFCGSCISEKPKLKLMIQLHSNDNFLKAILLLDINSRLHCARGVAMDTARAWIFQGPQQPLMSRNVGLCSSQLLPILNPPHLFLWELTSLRMTNKMKPSVILRTVLQEIHWKFHLVNSTEQDNKIPMLASFKRCPEKIIKKNEKVPRQQWIKLQICIWTFLVIITRRLSNKPTLTLWDSWQITNTSQCLL